jgi:hypothetical protein
VIPFPTDPWTSLKARSAQHQQKCHEVHQRIRLGVELKRLSAGADDRPEIGRRIVAELERLEPFYRAYRRRSGIDEAEKALMQSTFAIAEMMSRVLVYNDPDPGRDYDSWDEYIDEIVRQLVDIRSTLGASPPDQIAS